MIKSIEDIKILYDNERYKNENIANIRKQDIYDEYPKLRDIDFRLIDTFVDMSLSKIDKEKKIKELKKEKDDFIKENNIDSHYDEPIYTCKKCKDTGFVGDEKCECFREKELNMFSQYSGMEDMSKTYNFDNIDYKLFDRPINNPNWKIYADYVRYVVGLMKRQIDDINRKPSNALIYGPIGVGKSYIAKCMGSYAYSKKKSVMYIKTNEYLDYLYGKNKNNKEQYDVEELVYAVDFFILDDLGKEYNSEFSLSRIYNLIDSRIENNKSTIICTHFDKKDLLDIYGGSIISRIYNNYVVYRLYEDDSRSIKK